MHGSTILTADLGEKVAAVVGEIGGKPVAVVNRRARYDPSMCKQAAWIMLCGGVHVSDITGVLHGIRR